MNRFDGGQREAKIEYLDGDLRIVQTGSYVVCAMTGVQIPLMNCATGALYARSLTRMPRPP